MINLFEVENEGYRNEQEREFLTALCNYAAEWTRFGLTNDDCNVSFEHSILTVAFDISDTERSVILRSLRIDFTGTSVLIGDAGTNLFDSELDVNDPDVKEYRNTGCSLADFANVAAGWLTREFLRQIERREWITSSYHHQQYVMADTNQQLCWSDSENKKRFGLGTPTKVTTVHPPNKQTRPIG